MRHRFGRHELSIDRMELSTDGVARPLEPQVFDLLLLFVGSGGRVVSRDELIEKVWGGRIVSDSATFLEALPLDEPGSPSRREWMRTLHREWSIASDPRSASSDRQYIPIMEELRRQLPADAMISMGAGNYTVWARRFMSYDQYPSEFGPTSGAMGFGLPAGIGATFAYPARPAIVFAGDGCLMMTVEELMTAVSHDADITILLFNNGRYGTIRSHQDRAYPGRPYGTDLQNPDFAALARSCGARGWTVTDAGDFSEILAEALRTRGPGLIELRL